MIRLLAVLAILASVRAPQSVPRLLHGDYLAEDFTRRIQTSRSLEQALDGGPAELLARVEAVGGEWRVTRGGFSGQCGAATLRRDGSVPPEETAGGPAASFTVDGSARFTTTLCGGDPAAFVHVGDHRDWISWVLVGGRYRDGRGAKYTFGTSGRATFAGRRHLYRVPLDAASDRLEVDGVRYIRVEEGGFLKIYPTGDNGDRAAEPVWVLRRTETNQSMEEGVP